MKKFISVSFVLLLTVISYGQLLAQEYTAEKGNIPEKLGYKLIWHDEFNGSQLDNTKWKNRLPSPSVYAMKWVLDEKAHWLNGEGQLCMTFYTVPKYGNPYPPEIMGKFSTIHLPVSSMIRTIQEFTYGYHEVRIKMPIINGVGMAIWMQSKLRGGIYSESVNKSATEIDILEQTFFNQFGVPIDYKTATIHYGGAKTDKKSIKISVKNDIIPNIFDEKRDKPKVPIILGSIVDKASYTYLTSNINFRDNQYHTIAVLWTQEYYEFFFDDELIGRIEVGVAHTSDFMVFSPRIFNLKALDLDGVGMETDHLDKAVFMIDYYRVYGVKNSEY